MVQLGTPVLGDVENRHLISDVVVGQVAANTDLLPGFVYQNGTNGYAQAPTDDSVLARRLRFLRAEQNNLTISGIQDGNKGDKNCETYKKGAIVIAKIDGPCTVNQYVRNSTVTAGRVMKLAEPASPIGATPTSAEFDNFVSYENLKLAQYLGHAGETTGTNNPPTDAVDGDLVRLQLV